MAVSYDITRLLLRSLSPAPNGIDRVDLNLAAYFLDRRRSSQGVLLNNLCTLALENHSAASLVDYLNVAWGGEGGPDEPGYHWVRSWLLSPNGAKHRQFSPPVTRSLHDRGARLLHFARNGLRALGGIRAAIARDAVFLHTTQFPAMRMFRWLDHRPDVAPVFFVHDLLPLHHPGWFTNQNAKAHVEFLEVFLRYARGAIVNTEVVANDLRRFLAGRKGGTLPILVAPMPAAPIFAARTSPDRELRSVPYFVMCGTIEPRKNHRLILEVWDRLLRRDVNAAPKLVIAGRRGWGNEDVFRILDSMTPHSHIVETPDLSTAALRRLITNSRGVLVPSLAEGYGLPLVEARAAGTSVIASDIPVFREIANNETTFCGPQDPEAWMAAVHAHIERRDPRSSAEARAEENRAGWSIYFERLEKFLAEQQH
jgi:glycosyltransferase involved in cell wall biosynthesis